MSFLFMERGRNVFPKYELGAKRLTKKWCELTMGRKVCVPICILAVMATAVIRVQPIISIHCCEYVITSRPVGHRLKPVGYYFEVKVFSSSLNLNLGL